MHVRPLIRLLQMQEEGAKGPSPTFENAHLVLAMSVIGDSGIIGRQALAAKVGLGSGAIRTVLKKLKEVGYVDSIASGCRLTARGAHVYEGIRAKVSPSMSLGKSKLTVGDSQVALVVRRGGQAVKSGIEQRDSAIRLGADGATTYVITRGKFSIPGGSSDCESDFPSPKWAELRGGLKPKEGDAIVLVGARNDTTARLGAVAVALTLS